jgi:hypothetical protein
VAIALLSIAALAADVHIPNDCPTGTASQAGRSVSVTNDGSKITIQADTPAGNKDTSIHVWWWVTPKQGEGGTNGREKKNSKKHQTQTSCKAEIPIGSGDGSIHWVVAYDKWDPLTEDHVWTWGTDGTQSL